MKSDKKVPQMADGGEVAPAESPIMAAIRNYVMKHGGDAGNEQAEVKLAQNVDTSSDTPKGYAAGGVAAPNDNAPHKAPEGPSEDEKRDLVKKALSEGRVKFDDGGAVGPMPLPTDAPQESKWQAIMDAIGMAGKKTLSPILGLGGAPANVAESTANSPAVAEMVNSAPAVTNAVLGTSLQENPPLPAPVPPQQPAPVQPAVPPVAAKPAPHIPDAPQPDPLSQLGQFDPTTVAPGMNPGDRQALAAQVQGHQHSFGNLLAEAMGGLGDAIAARGGVQQNSLGNIIGLEKQQREEALSNFDKAREIAVQNHTMKNQADQDLINNVKARGEMLVSPQIAHTLGHPEWANKPTAQVSLALSAQKNVLDYTNNLMQRKQAALKDSAESVEQALKSGGIAGTQKMVDPQSRLRMIYTNAIRNDPEAFGYQVSESRK